MDGGSTAHRFARVFALRGPVVIAYAIAGSARPCGGENDLLVEAHWPGGEAFRLLLEDKLDAVLPPDQVERYLARARRHAAVDGIVVA